jgi:hypothetical protein
LISSGQPRKPGTNSHFGAMFENGLFVYGEHIRQLVYVDN